MSAPGQPGEFDHLAHAKEQGQFTGRWADSPDERSVPSVLEVLAHATIALAEEQRTANLIAILTARDETGRSAFDMEQMGAAIEQIGHRLGLSTLPDPKAGA